MDTRRMSRRPSKHRSQRSSGRSPPALEYSAHLKLEVLHLVADLLVDGHSITELQWADRRIPGQPHPRRKAEGFELRLKSCVVNLTCVREHRKAHRLIPRLCSRQREE